MTSSVVDRLYGESSSVAIKAPVRAASNANLTLSGLQTVGGVALLEGDRVLVTAQTDSTQNGIYNASSSGWKRAGDFNDNRDAVQGTVVIAQGALWASYQLTTPNPIQFGTSPIAFSAPAASMVTQAIIAALISGSTFVASVDAAAPIAIRQSYNYAGGTLGFVVPALNVRADVTNCGNNYPWAGLFNLHNTSTGVAQAVALYAQASKDVFNASPTWAAVFDLRETVATNAPGSGSVTVEIDHSANGLDTANGNRVGVDLVIRKYDVLNPVGNTCTWGYRVSAGTIDGGQSKVGYGFAFTPGSFGTVGFSTAHGTITTASFMMAQDQGIIWDGPTTNTIATSYDGVGIYFKTSGTKQARIRASDGSYWIQSGGSLVQVLSVPIAGYGTPTNSSHQASFNANTVTLPNLAAAVGQLIIDLKTHGMIAG